MPIFTNLSHLPLPIFHAVTNDPYSRGDSDISATGLVKPPRIVQLERRFDHIIKVDVSDRIWSLFGQGVHHVLERAAENGTDISEQRLFVERLGWTISGQFDLLRGLAGESVFTDYKVTSVWKILHNDYSDWEAQLNIYAHMGRESKLLADRIEVCAILRDWIRRKARVERKYPRSQVQLVPLGLWTPERTEAYILERTRLHQEAAALPTDELPLCTDEERWYSGDSFAVKRPGRKSAIRVLGNEEAATRLVEELSEAVDKKGKKAQKHFVEYRAGEHKRCMDYCDAAQVCGQWAAIKEREGIDEQGRVSEAGSDE